MLFNFRLKVMTMILMVVLMMAVVKTICSWGNLSHQKSLPILDKLCGVYHRSWTVYVELIYFAKISEWMV